MPYEKVGKNDPVCIADEVPFDIPDSWEWARFCNVVNYSMGKTPPRKEAEYWSEATHNWVSIADMVADGHIESTKEFVSQYAYTNAFKGKKSVAGTLLMSFKLTVGKVSILDIDAFHNEAIISIYPFIDDDKIMTSYLFKVLPLLSQLGETKTAIKGNTLNSESLDQLWIPLPPIKEQYRICQKLDELYPVLLEYEKAEEITNKLYKSFPELLKKSILQEAVQGKLVPQDENDEPASVLLERIREEKARLVKEGKIKKDKNESVIFRRDNSHYEKLNGIERCIDDEIPFEIPENWCWCRTSSFLTISSGDCLTSQKMDNGVYPVFGGNGITGYHSKYNVTEPTLVIGRVGFYCGSTHITPNFAWVTDNAFITTFDRNNIDILWLKLLLDSSELRKRSSSTAQPVISGKTVYPLLVPLPPIAEQRRIVSAYNSLLPLVEQL